MLGINQNTVTKAYRDLELMRLVVSRRGYGVRVAEGADVVARERTEKMVREHLLTAISECVAAGYSGKDIRGIVSDAIDAGDPPYRRAI